MITIIEMEGIIQLMMSLVENAQKRIESIVLDKNDKRLLLVYKGFPPEWIPQTLGQRLVDNTLFFPLDKIDTNYIQDKIFSIVTTINNIECDFFWLTYEEFIFVENLLSYAFDIRIIENNLYLTKFPYQNTLSDIKDIYTRFYYENDEMIQDSKQEEFEHIASFYGDIDYSSASDSYYVTYQSIDASKHKVINLFQTELRIRDLNISDDSNSSKISIELSDDEILFLDLIQKLIYSTQEFHQIEFILTADPRELPNDYFGRLAILKNVIVPKTEFIFKQKTIKRKDIKRLPEYLEILNHYWGYGSFKDLEMYLNIESRDRKTVEISQAQIIDDIVNQADAALSGKDYQDIYITSATGSGKSIMFQIPALYIREHFTDKKPLTLIISPLIGLMNDQVDSMTSRGIKSAARIHSNTPPYQREQILTGVKDGSVDLLYLSPETLQSRSDISMLIGERQIGLIIIDEAHIVTTWGRSFRADYWYLGIYLSKLRKKQRFPIVTFTATAIYGGKDDMYMDTRDSLNMEKPIAYFGKVKRDDIIMCIDSSGKSFEKAGRDYRKTKFQLALEHLQSSQKSKQKTLMYFPTIKLLRAFKDFLDSHDGDIADVTGMYYGSMEKEEKDEVLKSFKNGELRFVLATKAFGMGIDIPDINNVYHFAPTGNVVDYIQEIGRVSRDHDKVPLGFAWLDYLSNDFSEVNKLQGMGAIRKDQILEVMRKIISIYKSKGNNRNLIVNADEFRYIFSKDLDDPTALDNKIKTVMLMIEKDFSSPKKIGYSPFVARPRSLFGNEQILVKESAESILLNSRLKVYLNKVCELENSNYKYIYSVDVAGIWEKHFKHMSFPQFKFALFNESKRNELEYSSVFKYFTFATGITVPRVDQTGYSKIVTKYNGLLASFERFCREKRRVEGFFNIKELGLVIHKDFPYIDIFKARSIAQVIVNAAFDFGKLKNYKFIQERTDTRGESIYKINSQLDLFLDTVKNSLSKFYHDSTNRFEDHETFTVYFFRNRDNSKIDEAMLVLGLGQALGVLDYEVSSGFNPQIYIRVNSIYPLERAIMEGDRYRNFLLEDVHKRHRISVAMLTYLFTHKVEGRKKSERIKNYTSFFWDEIEDYFLGIIPKEVEDVLFSRD
ncbi:helicase-related protein [Enterococcus faecium]